MRTSIGARANLELIEENYRRWQRNPQSVDSGWSAFFEGFELGNLPQRDGATAAAAREAALQTRVDGLIYAYCSLGHTIARVDPLAETRPQNPLLSLREFGFSESDLDLRVSSKFFLDNQSMTLREMVPGWREFMPTPSVPNSCTFRIRECVIGSASDWRRDRTSIRLQQRCRWPYCGRCLKQNPSRFSCIHVTWGRKGSHFRVQNRSW